MTAILSSAAIESTRARVLEQLATRYMSEDGHNVPRARWVRVMLADVIRGIDRLRKPEEPAWCGAQACLRKLLYYEQHCSARRHRMSVEEAVGLVDMALHVHGGSNTVRISWPLLEQLSSTSIEEALLLKHLPDSAQPGTLWVELTGGPSSRVARWMARTVGMLLTRVPLHSLGVRTVAETVKLFPHWRTALDVLRALDQTAEPSVAYSVVVVQEESTALRLVPTVAAHAMTGSVRDLLLLHRETTQRERHREIRQAAVGALIRLLLARALPQSADILDLPLAPQESGTFYLDRAAGTVALRPKQRPIKPFRIESA